MVPSKFQQTETFRGGIEPLPMSSFWPLTAAKIILSGDDIKIRRLLGHSLAITREKVKWLKVQRIRLPPFIWQTIVEIRFLEDGNERKILFVPFKGNQFLEALTKYGWPVLGD